MSILNKLLILFFTGNGLVFLTTRALIFMENYALGKRTKLEHERFAHMCFTHSDLREIEPQRCQERTLAAEMSPWLYALKQTAAKTHTCGYLPCSDLYGTLLDKSSSALFNITLGMGIFVLFYAAVMRIVSPMVKPQTDLQNYHTASIESGDMAYMHPTIRMLPRKRLQSAADFSE